MKGLENIKSAISAETQQQCSELIKNAESRAEAILSDAKKEADSRIAQTESVSERSAAARIERARQSALLSSRRAVDAHRQALVYQVFDGVYAALGSLSGDARYALLLKLARQAKASAGEGELVLCANDRKQFGERLSKDTGLALAADTAEMSGGVVLRSGKTDLNASYEVLVRELRESRASQVGERLFSQPRE
jgi:V/A-type H+-transporting ATPase subunit E